MKTPEEIAKEIVVPWENENYVPWGEDLGSSARNHLIRLISTAIQAERDARLPSVDRFKQFIFEMFRDQQRYPDHAETYYWLRDNMQAAPDARVPDFDVPDCGDNSCYFKGQGSGGMRTNGGCRCDRGPQGRKYVRQLHEWYKSLKSNTSRERSECTERPLKEEV